MRRQKKPCPGCGAVDRERKAEEVCTDCAHAIKKWREHIASVQERKDLTTVGLKGASHWYPQFYFGGPRASIEGLSETRSEIGKLFWELGRVISVTALDWKDIRPTDVLPLYFRPDVREPLKKGASHRERIDYPASDGSGGGCETYGKIETRALDILRKLWDHAARFAEMAYFGGVQDGRDIIFQMARGEMSVSELQEADVRLARDIQNSGKLHQKMKGKSIASFAK